MPEAVARCASGTSACSSQGQVVSLGRRNDPGGAGVRRAGGLDSATALGLVLAPRLLSAVGLLLAGGVVRDRISRRTVMVGADLVRRLSHAAIAALLLSAQPRSGHWRHWPRATARAPCSSPPRRRRSCRSRPASSSARRSPVCSSRSPVPGRRSPSTGDLRRQRGIRCRAAAARPRPARGAAVRGGVARRLARVPLPGLGVGHRSAPRWPPCSRPATRCSDPSSPTGS
jgi:hypothetical protein